MAINVLIPQELHDSHLGTGIGQVSGGVRRGEIWLLKKIRNLFGRGLSRRLTNALSRAIAPAFESVVERSLLRRGAVVRQVQVGGPNNRNTADFLWNSLYIEVKSGRTISGREVQQLNAITETARAARTSFSYVFLEKPTQDALDKITSRSGTAIWFFE